MKPSFDFLEPLSRETKFVWGIAYFLNKKLVSKGSLLIVLIEKQKPEIAPGFDLGPYRKNRWKIKTDWKKITHSKVALLKLNVNKFDAMRWVICQGISGNSLLEKTRIGNSLQNMWKYLK